MSESNVILRLKFRPECAIQFLYEEDVAQGRIVQEHDTYTLEEAYEFIRTFHTSLLDASILVDREKVVSMSDFTYEI